MKDINYILLIIFLVIFVLMYGGHNNQAKIEYNVNYFNNINKLELYEKKVQRFNVEPNFKDKNYINIENYIKTSQIIIPNLVDMFFIKIEPYSFYSIDSIFNLKKDEHVMIIFNHYNLNPIELCLGIDGNSLFFYKLNKKISITTIYDLYNNSDKIINITIFFMKKPFWHL